MLAKQTSSYGKIRSGLLRHALRYPLIALLSHWAFQSLFYVDRTERWFKLSLDLALTVLLNAVLHHWLAAFLVAHTLNFLFNGQLWGSLKHYGFTHWPPVDFDAYVKAFIARAQREPSIQSLYVYGSLSRNEWTDHSDLDARLLRKPGALNGLRACAFLLAERTQALFKRFPLDLYVLDHAASAAGLCAAEKSVDLLARTPLHEKAKTSPALTTVVFLRGVNFAREIGASDWRIGLRLPEFGFHTIVFGRGASPVNLPDGVEVFTPMTLALPLIGTLHLTAAYLVKLWQISPAVVICNPGLFLAGNLYKFFRPQVKLILDVRSIPVEGQGLVRRLQQIMFKLALRSPLDDGVSVITSGMLTELRSDYGLAHDLPTVVWESAYDDHVFHLSARRPVPERMQQMQNQFILMFHGSLSPQRGLDQVIRSLRLLHARGMDDVVLVLIGQGAAHESLLQLARAQQVDAQVICFPPLAYWALPDYVGCADLGLDPLPDHPWWRNQSALKVYEYLAMGKPVLATDLPCHRAISEAVILLPDNRPETIAEAIIHFRNCSVAAREALQQAAVTDSQPHTWQARARSLAFFLNSAVLREAY